MDYHLNWLIEGQLLQLTMLGTFTGDDIRETYNAVSNTVIQQGQRPVHSIVDIHAVEDVDMDVTDLGTIIDRRITDWFGYTVIITESNLMKFLVGITSKLTTSSYQTVPTYSDAIAYLEQQAPDIMQDYIATQ